jgi:hypothetical protein
VNGFAIIAAFKALKLLVTVPIIPPDAANPSFNDFTPSTVRFAPSAKAIAPNAAASNSSACSLEAAPDNTKLLASNSTEPPNKLTAPSIVLIVASCFFKVASN